MNKQQLIERIALDADISKASAGRALDSALTAIAEALGRGDSVSLVGFGSFHVTARAARSGRNPRTGTAIAIAPSRSARFRAGKALRDGLK